MIYRHLQPIIERFMFKGKAILITGARQVGKTTLVKEIAKKYANPYLFWSADEPDIEQILTRPTSTEMKERIGDYKLLIIDEAQRVTNIGVTLKLLVDNLKNVQLIVTGSSAIGLKDSIYEPLTGRKLEFHLHPFSYAELVQSGSVMEETRMLEQRLIFGHYPDVILSSIDKSKLLLELSGEYLYKDILSLDSVRKPSVIPRLLQGLALQISNEGSLSELAETAGCDRNTVIRYLDLLEKSFVIFTLPSLARNQRNELKKTRKIYFWDTGIRNALINQFNPLSLREDTGKLWENFMVSELIKKDHYNDIHANYYFWRTHQMQEIDLIREAEGAFDIFEFKWNPSKNVKLPNNFSKDYKIRSFKVINKENYSSVLMNNKMTG